MKLVVAANKRAISSSCCHQLKVVIVIVDDSDAADVRLVDAIDDMEDKLGDVTKIWMWIHMCIVKEKVVT